MAVIRLALLGLVVSLGLSTSEAAELIGQATTAKNEVTGTLDQIQRAIGTGDSVSANEQVKTGVNSATAITFLDNTNLTIGASSTIVLDRFVYDPNRGADDAVINLTKGAFRFVTGKSDPKKFTIKTQVATLGILGTDFVVLCDGSNCCGVVVAKGIVTVCPRSELPPQCTKSRDGDGKICGCPEAYDLDRKLNATVVGANGKNTGQKSIPQSYVAALIGNVAAGRGLTLASIEKGFGSPNWVPISFPKPVNATPN